ncbi:MAG: hypothetical protein P4L40_25120 [Terracidiphilus sp.]|nr:hypothetical protein [Terracidiphilus sp.]
MCWCVCPPPPPRPPAGKVKPARVEKGRLYYGDKSFNVKDFVLVRSELSDSEFSGKIMTINDTEVCVCDVLWWGVCVCV